MEYIDLETNKTITVKGFSAIKATIADTNNELLKSFYYLN